MAATTATADRAKAEQEAQELLQRAHDQAIHATPDKMAVFFQNLLGQKLTAMMTGISDPKAVGKWARGERAPRGETERKLREAYHIAILLTLAEDVQTARGWFMGMNPFLKDRSPIKVIASAPDGGERAMDAARAFICYG
jgi:hypothetical protein